MDKVLEHFLAIAEAGSFLAAAETLAVSQPALSYSIRKLEQSLNVVLFERSSRGVRLTEAGETLYENAMIMRRLYGNALGRIERQRVKAAHGISIGSGYSSWDLFLKDIVMAQFRAHPDAPIHVSLGSALRCMAQLLAGDISLFIGNQIPGFAHANAVEFLPMGMSRDGYYVRAGHPLLEAPRSLAEIFAWPSVVAVPSESRLDKLQSENARTLPELPQGSYGHAFTSNSLAVCLDYLQAADAVLTHSVLLGPYLARQGVHQIETIPGEPERAWPLGIYVVTEAMGDAKVAQMVELISEQVRALDLPPVPGQPG
ncbi:LysR family transcriptional regulator [Mangrovicoccus algicola]|uniref:LysR family transcriptional regulator n=1 Tax=Mangrovicoccus algicola TaxID=2771008 RepID=A0A8J6YR09_9RHOB|nr:LysR family transcriptional regulator [Mangrovicoccus algicola]MBE3637998.1 LysR family transcriptional regulator [Mangrovicoccus algicola]